MARNPNDFLPKTKDILAKRAGHICSNPHCHKNTAGPHTSDHRAINIGEAAHIRGARPNSARYDPSMMPIERRNITNGIWLCGSCATLIDRDEEKYSVRLLYKWKKEHELEIAECMESSNLKRIIEREIMNEELVLFKDESPAAQQLVIDKPEYWEYLLTIELLRTKPRNVLKGFDDLKRGLIYRPTKNLSTLDFLPWFQGKVNDIVNLLHIMNVVSNEEFGKAWGEFGIPGNAIKIRETVGYLVMAYEGLLEWELSVRFTEFPQGLEEIKSKMQGWTEILLEEMMKIESDLVRILRSVEKETLTETITARIDLTFYPPKNLDEVTREIKTWYFQHPNDS